MTGLIESFSTVVSIIIAFVGVVGVLYFVYGAFMLMMSGGNSSKAETGKQAMVQALIGVALVLVAFTVVNTVTSLVGSSGSAVETQQVAGRDSVSLEAPRVVSVNVTSGAVATATVSVVFSEPVVITGTVAVSVRNKGVINCDSTCPTTTATAANSLVFSSTATNGNFALTPGTDVVEKFALGRGASIRDIDGNAALYAFQPVIAP